MNNGGLAAGGGWECCKHSVVLFLVKDICVSAPLPLGEGGLTQIFIYLQTEATSVYNGGYTSSRKDSGLK